MCVCVCACVWCHYFGFSFFLFIYLFFFTMYFESSCLSKNLPDNCRRESMAYMEMFKLECVPALLKCSDSTDQIRFHTKRILPML